MCSNPFFYICDIFSSDLWHMYEPCQIWGVMSSINESCQIWRVVSHIVSSHVRYIVCVCCSVCCSKCCSECCSKCCSVCMTSHIKANESCHVWRSHVTQVSLPVLLQLALVFVLPLQLCGGVRDTPLAVGVGVCDKFYVCTWMRHVNIRMHGILCVHMDASPQDINASPCNITLRFWVRGVREIFYVCIWMSLATIWMSSNWSKSLRFLCYKSSGHDS